jgi:hypothetical protein
LLTPVPEWPRCAVAIVGFTGRGTGADRRF